MGSGTHCAMVGDHLKVVLLVVVRNKVSYVSGPVVQPTVGTHARFITNGYLRMGHGRERCNGIEMVSRGSLNKSSLFRFSYCA